MAGLIPLIGTRQNTNDIFYHNSIVIPARLRGERRTNWPAGGLPGPSDMDTEDIKKIPMYQPNFSRNPVAREAARWCLQEEAILRRVATSLNNAPGGPPTIARALYQESIRAWDGSCGGGYQGIARHEAQVWLDENVRNIEEMAENRLRSWGYGTSAPDANHNNHAASVPPRPRPERGLVSGDGARWCLHEERILHAVSAVINENPSSTPPSAVAGYQAAMKAWLSSCGAGYQTEARLEAEEWMRMPARDLRTHIEARLRSWGVSVSPR